MTSRTTPHHEYPSTGVLAETYYASGKIMRVPHDSVPETCGLTGFRIVDAQCVRSGENAREAYEITLQMLGNRQAARELQPGTVFALEPKNHKDTVNAVLSGLLHEDVGQQKGTPLDAQRVPEVAEQTVELPVKTAYMEGLSAQRLSKREALSGAYDLSRPTVQLVNLLLQRKGLSASMRTATRIAESHSVEQLLEEYPGLVTVEELCANQPTLNSRPYTISDYDREAGTLKIVVSDVEAEIPAIADGEGPERKQHGVATRMLLDLAKNPDAQDYTLNGSVSVSGPKIFFPCMTELTPSMDSYRRQTRNEYWQNIWDRFSPLADTDDKTLFLLGTGSGIAPYLALLHEYERRRERYPGKVVLINGGRGEEGEMFKEKIRHFLEIGVLDDYVYADSAKEVRVQNALQAQYGEELKGLLKNDKAMVYVCGAEGAKDSVNDALAEIAGFERGSEDAAAFIAELEDKCLVQSTASKPDRFFTHWRKQQEPSSYLLPEDRQCWTDKVGGKSASNQKSWARVISSGESRAGGVGRI